MSAPANKKLSALWLVNRPLAIQTIAGALSKYRGNIVIACQSLGGVNPRTLYRWAKDDHSLAEAIRKARLLALHG